jgi:hypothetical protein
LVFWCPDHPSDRQNCRQSPDSGTVTTTENATDLVRPKGFEPPTF